MKFGDSVSSPRPLQVCPQEAMPSPSALHALHGSLEHKPHSGCPQQAPEREEQEQQTEVPKHTPTSESSSQNVTTVTVLLQAPPGTTPSPPASPHTSPSSASPEPPLESAKPQVPDAEALGSSERPSSLPIATSPEPQEQPASPDTEEPVVNTVSPDEEWKPRQVSSLVRP